MAEVESPRHLTPAPVREENPHITVITGLEGPIPPRPEAGTNEPAADDEEAS
ncbi:hypothetical protein [Streptomyces avicenniae]|uniref:hypothetical protein n=1 Tax=Streptomyces avicenniae TaxID=500153 RepID=UPI000AD25B30|nr:hypothetical protein [Streptomyces avicenniae]